MQKISTCFWFDTQAEDAARFYVSIFNNAKITNVSYYEEGGPGPAGQAMMVNFEIEGQEYAALNGGPMFQLTPAVSQFVKCKDQEEVDHLWAKLTDGGNEMPCGWVTDKFGVTWQIIPQAMLDMMASGDPEKSKRVFATMMDMKKIEIAPLQRAFDGE